jgi:dTDP-4-amino-4,6-dideoxygalactose transaminase
MISFSKPHITKPARHNLAQVLESGQLAQGPYVKRFEKAFAQVTGEPKHAIAVNSGTAALHVALLCMDIGPGDEVIVPAFTFVASANAVLMVGAKPVFADIEADTYNLDPEDVENKITTKTKAVIAVNLNGLPVNYTKLRQITTKHKLHLIEDAAQSIGASFKNKMSGNLADISCFSLYATKNLTTGEGGVITTNNSAWAKKARRLRHHGQELDTKYYYYSLGYNYRLTDIQAAIGLGQMTTLSAETKRRQTIARYYTKTLANVHGLTLPHIPKDQTHVFHQYTLRIKPTYKFSRSELQQKLHDQGIPTGIYYPKPLYSFAHLRQGRKIHLPQTTLACKEVLSLPIHPHLTDTEIEYIAQAVRNL